MVIVTGGAGILADLRVEKKTPPSTKTTFHNPQRFGTDASTAVF